MPLSAPILPVLASDANLGEKPRILRANTRAGYGVAEATGKALDGIADLLAFAARCAVLASLQLIEPAQRLSIRCATPEWCC